MSLLPAGEVRQALIETLPAAASQFGDNPIDPRFLYVPQAHTRALDPNNMVVVGMRGAGKTLWWQCLKSPEHRRILAQSLKDLHLDELVLVDAGFGEGLEPERRPDANILQDLVESGFAPRDIWWVVVLSLVAGFPADVAEGTWKARCRWMVGHREETSRRIAEADGILSRERHKHLVLFDALDTTASTRPVRQALLSGLLQVMLECRATRAIRIKVFVRPDMLDAASLAFPDSSKVIQEKVDLSWPSTDLFGLLWQYLGNNDRVGEAFRRTCQDLCLGLPLWPPWSLLEGSFRMSLVGEDIQQQMFKEIAGKWMGKDARRGFPYTWLPGHLSDAYGKVSPRSFLASLRAAALDSEQRYPAWPVALHYESIKRGVQEASRIRRREVTEDQIWVDLLMSPLEGMNLPLDREVLFSVWTERKVLQILQAEADAGHQVPLHLSQGAWGLLDDLNALGICERTSGDRVNMPDVFRVAWGIGRKGGVKPVARN